MYPNLPAAGEEVAGGDLGLDSEERVQRLGIRGVFLLCDVVEALDVVTASAARLIRRTTRRRDKQKRHKKARN